MKIKYQRDKQQIADCFIKNVEYFRKHHRYASQYIDDSDSLRNIREEHYKTYPGAKWDPANFFEPYASRFNLKNDQLKETFESKMKQAGISGINGHRSVGGYRASMYNALPLESVQVLVEVMQQVEREA